VYTDSSMKVARFWLWFLGILTVVILGLLVWDLIEIFAGRFALIGIVGIALVLPLAVLIPLFSLAWFKVRSGNRLAAVARLNPDAYLVQLVATRPFVEQARNVTTALGLTISTLRPNIYVTFAASTDLLRIYSGGAHPKLQLTIPTSAIDYARAGTFSNGARTVPTIDLGFVSAAGAEPLPLQLIPLIQPGLFAKAMEPQFMPAELLRMQRATHPQTIIPS